MEHLVTVLIALLLMTFAIWIAEQLPLPAIPRQLAVCVLGFLCLLYILRRLHWV